MTLLYNSEGYFCEGEVGKNWQFEMVFGKILLTDLELSFVKKSNISLTEIGNSVDDFHRDYQIPLSKIIKAYEVHAKLNTLHMYQAHNKSSDPLWFFVFLFH